MIEADATDIERRVGAFQAALEAEEPSLITPQLDRVLLALDESNQDQTAERLAVALVKRAGARLVVIYAYEGPRDEAKEGYLARRFVVLRDMGIETELVEHAANTDQKSFDQILSVQQGRSCDLIIGSAPYLDDFFKLGRASVGTNLDMLLSRSPVPLLVAREPKDEPDRCLEQILLPTTPYVPTTAEAAAWAFRIVGEEGMLQLLAIADRELLESASVILSPDLHERDHQLLAGLTQPEMAGLIAALQRRAVERGLGCRVTVQSGEMVPTVADLANSEELTVVTSCPRRPVSMAYQRVHALLRESRNPVLVV